MNYLWGLGGGSSITIGMNRVLFCGPTNRGGGSAAPPPPPPTLKKDNKKERKREKWKREKDEGKSREGGKISKYLKFL